MKMTRLPVSQSSLVVLLVILNLMLVGAQSSNQPKSPILDLTKDTLERARSNNNHILVNFRSTLCGHCRSFHSEWRRVASALEGAIPVAQVDLAREPEIKAMFNIISTPTIIMFVKGQEPEVYKGHMDAESIIRFAFRKTSPILEINTSEELATLKEEWESLVIGYFKDKNDLKTKVVWSEEWKAFTECAKSSNTSNFGFGYVSNPQIMQEESVLRIPSVVVYHKWREMPNHLPLSGWQQACEWIVEKSTPVIEEYHWDCFQREAVKGPVGILYLDPDAPQRSRLLVEKVREMAGKWTDKMKFFYADGMENMEQILKFGGLGNLPTFIIHDEMKKSNYPFDDAYAEIRKTVTAEKIDKWIDSFFKKKLTPRLKTAVSPTSNTKKDHLHTTPHVQTITGRSFSTFISQPKDVVVLFYDPWCEECEKFVPVFEAFGQVVCGVDSIAVGKIDTQENSLPPDIAVAVHKDKVPAVIIFPANNKQTFKVYRGGAASAELAKWTKNNVRKAKLKSTPLKIPPVNWKELEEEKRKEIGTIKPALVRTGNPESSKLEALKKTEKIIL